MFLGTLFFKFKFIIIWMENKSAGHFGILLPAILVVTKAGGLVGIISN